MTQPVQRSPPSLSQDVMRHIIEQMPVKHARRTSKAIAKGSPNYTQMLKQRGYTDEFLVELLDAVELIDPGLLKVLKIFYEFRKKHKKSEKLLTKDLEIFTNTLIHIEKQEYYDRLFFIKLYYRYKIYSLFNLDWDKHNYTQIYITFYKDNLSELTKLLEGTKALKQDIQDYKQAFEEEDFYFRDLFIESLKTLFNEIENHYRENIEKYEAAIRDYHARRAAEKEALKEKQATKRLIKRVNKAVAERERASAAAATVSNRPESARDLRARLRSQRGTN